jgi:capsid protein
MKDLDEYEDATLMKQKIAACLAVITSDIDGTGAPLGTADDTTNPGIDTLEPGAIINAPPGGTSKSSSRRPCRNTASTPSAAPGDRDRAERAIRGPDGRLQ